MTKKTIIIFAAVFLAAIGITVGGLVLLRPNTAKNETVTELPGRGVKPSDATVFAKIENVTSIPSIQQTPKQSGWTLESDDAQAKLGNAKLKSAECTARVDSFQTPFVDKTAADYRLSKDYAVSIASGEEGTIDEDFIITIPTTQGNAEFYSGTYHPISVVNGPDTDTPSLTTKQTRTVLDGTYTTFVAVRLVAVPIGQSEETTATGEGVVGLTKMVPSVAIKYQCPADKFDVDKAIAFIKQFTFDFTSTNQSLSAPANATK